MKTRKKILLIVLAGVAGVILFFGFIFYSFLYSIPPCGFNDGPFFGRTIELDFDTLNFDTSVSTELGNYGIVNRTDKQAPILVKSTNDQLDWALELDVSLEPKFSNTFFWSAERLSFWRMSYETQCFKYFIVLMGQVCYFLPQRARCGRT
jgi:hypothetical protein